MPKHVVINTIVGASLAITGLAVSKTVLAESIAESFAAGKASVNMRYRYESVDDSVNKDAAAHTLRTRLGYTTGDYMGFKAHADFEVVNEGGEFAPENAGYAVVADPSVEELNQAWLSYMAGDTEIKFGRQRIILDNARFVGNVGWRQNEQTFDGIKFTNTSFEDTTITLAYITQVNSIFGTDIAETGHTLLNVGFDKTPIGKVTAYSYMLDYDGVSNNDLDTLGVRLKGSSDNFLYTLELAQQSEGADRATDLSATYLFGEVGYKMDAAKVFLGYESLGSDDGAAAFQTPLATKHAFNGWADKFLGTPAAGLNDTYIKVVSKVAGMKLVGLYHDYSSDEGSTDLGSELDLVLVKPFSKTLKGLVKLADYSAGDSGNDTQKIWLALEANFKQ